MRGCGVLDAGGWVGEGWGPGNGKGGAAQCGESAGEPGEAGGCVEGWERGGGGA